MAKRGSEFIARARAALRVGVLATVLILGVSLPAHADPCPPTDLDCLTDTVDDTVDGAQDAVDSTVDEVGQVVDDTTETVVDPPDDEADPAGDGPTVSPGADGSGNAHDDATEGGAGGGKGPQEEQTQPPLPAATQREPRDVFVDKTPTSHGSGAGGASLAEDAQDASGGGLDEAARQFAFPLLLALLIAWFLILQNRLDRSEPGLAHAPLGRDELTFG
jgi:hypothetical protein